MILVLQGYMEEAIRLIKALKLKDNQGLTHTTKTKIRDKEETFWMQKFLSTKFDSRGLMEAVNFKKLGRTQHAEVSEANLNAFVIPNQI